MHQGIDLVLGEDLYRFADLGDLKADDAIAVDADKLDGIGRHAVDPLLEGHLAVHLADFLVGLAEGEHDHVGGHADHDVMAENSVLEGFREGIGEGLDGGLHVEGDEWCQKSLDLRGGDRRHAPLEGEGDVRALGIVFGVVRNDGRGHCRVDAYLNMLEKAVFGVGTAVEAEDEFVVIELDIGNGDGIARFSGNAVGGDHVEVGLAGGIELAVGDQCESSVAPGEGTHGPALLAFKIAEEGGFGASVHGALGKLDVGGLNLGKAAVDGSAVGANRIAVGVNGDDLASGRGCREQRDQRREKDETTRD